jgi:hypothetical protein
VEIMEKENGSLVDRPITISAGETLSGGMRLLLVRAGNQFRKLRRYARASCISSLDLTAREIEHCTRVFL